MYLNFCEGGIEKVACDVEPKHKMYLNNSSPCQIQSSTIVEPKHKMYLNGVPT